VPLVPTARVTTTQFIGISLPKLQTPLPDCVWITDFMTRFSMSHRLRASKQVAIIELVMSFPEKAPLCSLNRREG
jgi:hypothetical protein